jgi:hypothetical protein
LGLVLAGAWAAAEDAPTFEDEIYTLVDRYCIDCHNSDRAKGDLNLERFESTTSVLDSLAVWKRAGMRIANGQMPPKKADKPTDAEKETFKLWLESLSLKGEECGRIATEESLSWFRGYVMSRRLNRDEYENTVSDLLGMDLELAHMFPADGSGGSGFNNAGGALFLSAIQVEKYLESADYAIETVLPPRRARRGGPRGAQARTSTEEKQRQAAARRRLQVVKPGWKQDPRDAAAAAMTQFMERAWRRPVNAEEVERVAALFEEAYERGDGYEASLKLAYKAVLVSPNFLFLAEPEPAQFGTYPLGDFPLASRLSYFLWGSMPDDELFALAREGRLQEDAVLRAQVARMLKDPKAKALGELFAVQWLGLTDLGDTKKPDAERFPDFDDALAKWMRQEAITYFNHIIHDDRSLVELIDADYTFANEALCTLYGVEGVEGDELRRVELDEPGRGGVLGMAAVLTATSQPLRTSPVLRGKWVLENLLGDHVPPPPPDAGTLPEDDVQDDGLTFRQRMEAHRKKPECASCHDRMDPIGFGLENFDPIGRWRDTQADAPVNSEGVLPSGEAFNGPEELKAILLKRKHAVAKQLTRKMIGYAMGRSLNRYDKCVIDDSMAALEANDYRPSVLLTEIVLSYPFRHRYSAGAKVAKL